MEKVIMKGEMCGRKKENMIYLKVFVVYGLWILKYLDKGMKREYNF